MAVWSFKTKVRKYAERRKRLWPFFRLGSVVTESRLELTNPAPDPHGLRRDDTVATTPAASIKTPHSDSTDEHACVKIDGDTHEDSNADAGREHGKNATESTNLKCDEDEVQRALLMIQEAADTVSTFIQRLQNEREGSLMKVSETQEELLSSNQTIQTLRQKWVAVSSELRKLRAEGQETSQLADSDLIEAVESLRYQVRNFAAQHFPHRVSGQPEEDSRRGFSEFSSNTIAAMAREHGRELMLSEEKWPAMAQLYLWTVLTTKIFYKFRWLIKFLKKPRQKSQNQISSTTHNISMLILQHMGPYNPTANQQCMLDDLRQIVEKAIQIDRDLCLQTAKYSWEFPRTLRYDPTCMEIPTGAREHQPEAGDLIDLATAPGLSKSKCTKEGLEPADFLLKMEVTCAFFHHPRDILRGRHGWASVTTLALPPPELTYCKGPNLRRPR
ncbi:hypothetical protein F5Y17DRAFT_476763 [Xylariaceae sp. FL0594]|nr:hypothetical protein F5Y17DRAFT_476763 [Xylariaceae sp. FL0594]